MPVRIKPVYDLGACVLDLDSIKGICALVDKNFDQSKFSAEDDIWEVYDEDSAAFVSAVENRETLDSFVVEAQNAATSKVNRVINITFNKYQATVKFSGSHDQDNWLEHFLIDLKKHLHPPEFRQRLLPAEKSKGNYDPIPPLASWNKTAGYASWFIALALKLHEARYSLIVVKKSPPNALIENVKANLISNFIGGAIIFALGMGFAWFALWLYQTHNINVNKYITPPTVPSPSPNSTSTP